MSSAPKLRHAPLSWRENNTPESIDFGDIYYSLEGGLAESEYVFLQHNQLPKAWADKAHFTVGELGFGTGLNFLLTWDRFRRLAPASSRLTFLSVERSPLSSTDLLRAIGRWPELLPLAQELAKKYPVLRSGLHLIEFDGGRVRLIIGMGEATSILPTIEGTVDAWFLDGFAPAKNPELWTEEILAAVAKLSHRGTTFATYTAAGYVRRTLEAVGFSVEKFSGYGSKRESLCGVFTKETANLPSKAPTHVAVIGGGIAGLMTSMALTKRGISVIQFEQGQEICGAASGNPRGVIYPYLSANRGPMADLYNSCFDYLRKLLADDPGLETTWVPCGALQFPSTTRLQKLFPRLAQESDLLDPYGTLVGCVEGSKIAGVTISAAAIWMPLAGTVQPKKLGSRVVSICDDKLDLRLGQKVSSVKRAAGGWQTMNDHGDVLSETDQVILAGAHEVKNFNQTAHLPLRAVRGQLAELAATEETARLRTILCYEGYTLPANAGRHVIGASYEYDDDSLELKPGVRQDFLDKLSRWFPAAVWPPVIADSGRVSFRATTPDRMPLVGAVADHPGLWVSAGFGSRGMTVAPLCGELLASALCGEIAALETELLAKVSPSRFVKT